MERRDRSLKAFRELNYIDSLDASQRVAGLTKWVEEYLVNDTIENFDLELKELKALSELMYKNISFLKEYKENTRLEILDIQNMKKFLNHQ